MIDMLIAIQQFGYATTERKLVRTENNVGKLYRITFSSGFCNLNQYEGLCTWSMDNIAANYFNLSTSARYWKKLISIERSPSLQFLWHGAPILYSRYSVSHDARLSQCRELSVLWDSTNESGWCAPEI